VPQHNPVSELYGQFLPPNSLVFALTALSTVGPVYRQVPFQIMSNQLNLPQVESNQVVEKSQGWSTEILSLIAKGLNAYADKVFLCFILYTFALWGIVCRCMRIFIDLIHFRLRL
jgi:hypothetical protein